MRISWRASTHAIQEDGDPAHLLPMTGALNVDFLAGTARWQPLPKLPMPDRAVQERRRYLLN